MENDIGWKMTLDGKTANVNLKGGPKITEIGIEIYFLVKIFVQFRM